MNEDNFKHEYSEPWDPGFYQTGSTNPPKKRSGAIAILLTAVIILAGIASILGVMNIRLFAQVKQQQKAPADLSVHPQSIPTEEPTAVTEEIDDADAVTIPLEQSPEAMENVMQDGGLSLQEIYEKNIDSVVSISCTGKTGSSSGTGVIVTDSGYIVTNCHVVEDSETIAVQLTDSRVFQATLIGADSTSDLAVLHVKGEDLTPAEFGDSDSLRVGDGVCAIGDPLGVELRGTMTDGIVSAINRDITTGGRTMTLIQTNAALNSGNSGGPLINCYGQVVGINTMKIGDYMNSAGVEGLGFAIPSTTVKDIVDQLINQGYVSGRPYLGITGETVSALYQYYYRLPNGIFITGVDAGSDAQSKGIQSGDILMSLDGVRITSPEELTTALYSYQVGDKVQAVIFRNNRQYDVELIIEEATK